jgi:DNA modification methylase
VLQALKTSHRVIFGDAESALARLRASTVDLVVTSPPYPMIQMWDGTFAQLNGLVGERIRRGDGEGAFELMHSQLDAVWRQVHRVLRPGGISCINVGDATRKIGGSFRVFPNHARILMSCMALGFEVLPEILWRKESNKPTKFMGSGMLPGAAYVTQEHEYILILRKRGRRANDGRRRLARRTSAFFWEERNVWFSDVWEDLRGDRQRMGVGTGRGRSAAFPFELAYRLVSMFSAQGDVVLDPFLGTGTTTLAAMASGRSSVGIELDARLGPLLEERLEGAVGMSNAFNEERLSAHARFVGRAKKEGRELRHANPVYSVPVMTGQETLIRVPVLKEMKRKGDGLYHVSYR